MNFKDLLDYCKAQAILNHLSPSELSVWRDVCRSYSKKFSTPLHLCLDGTIPAEDILLAEMEDQLASMESDDQLENLLEEIYILEDPTYEVQRRKDLDSFIEESERKEEERISAGKPIHKDLNEETKLFTEEPQLNPEVDQKKQGGFIDLSYLEREDQGGGF
jgi:hypothetical protein